MSQVTTRPTSLVTSPVNEPAASGTAEQATSSGAAQLEMRLDGGEVSTTPVKQAPKHGEISKPVYKATPHARKIATASPNKASNSFAILGSSDEEVESLILKAKQTRKTIHPRLLGTVVRAIAIQIAVSSKNLDDLQIQYASPLLECVGSQ